jgi:hypothetical protein
LALSEKGTLNAQYLDFSTTGLFNAGIAFAHPAHDAGKRS